MAAGNDGNDGGIGSEDAAEQQQPPASASRPRDVTRRVFGNGASSELYLILSPVLSQCVAITCGARAISHLRIVLSLQPPCPLQRRASRRLYSTVSMSISS